MRFCLIVFLLVSFGYLSSLNVKLEYELRENCSYFEKYSTSTTTNFNIKKVTDEIKNEFTCADTSMYFGELDYDGHSFLLFKKTNENSERVFIYNTKTKKIESFNFEDKIGYSFKSPKRITINFFENHSAVFSLYSISESDMQISREDIRVGKVTIANESYKIVLKSNDLDFNKQNNYSLYIDKNQNDVYDFSSITDEKYGVSDIFEINNNLYKISNISSDGFNLEIEKTNREIRVAKNCILPEFKYHKNGLDKMTFIFWWTPGCGGAIVGIPAINRIWEKYKDNDNFEFLALTTIDKEDLTEQLKEMKYFDNSPLKAKFPTLANNSELTELFGDTFPRVIITDRAGVIQFLGSCSFSSMKYDPEKDPNYKNYDSIINHFLND
ncbi:MAG: hypothetical protein K8S56_02585 [Candidatus Cloacimonetes bacterium]|nr:hypothetical protein [Candidatus Cloacimonadota bacterium]